MMLISCMRSGNTFATYQLASRYVYSVLLKSELMRLFQSKGELLLRHGHD